MKEQHITRIEIDWPSTFQKLLIGRDVRAQE